MIILNVKKMWHENIFSENGNIMEGVIIINLFNRKIQLYESWQMWTPTTDGDGEENWSLFSEPKAVGIADSYIVKDAALVYSWNGTIYHQKESPE